MCCRQLLLLVSPVSQLSTALRILKLTAPSMVCQDSYSNSALRTTTIAVRPIINAYSMYGLAASLPDMVTPRNIGFLLVDIILNSTYHWSQDDCFSYLRKYNRSVVSATTAKSTSVPVQLGAPSWRSRLIYGK